MSNSTPPPIPPNHCRWRYSGGVWTSTSNCAKGYACVDDFTETFKDSSGAIQKSVQSGKGTKADSATVAHEVFKRKVNQANEVARKAGRIPRADDVPDTPGEDTTHDVPCQKMKSGIDFS